MFRKTPVEELNRLSIEEFKETKKTQLIIILDNIRSAHNTGSVFRTSDAFKIEKIFLCGITACPPNKEIHKTALGATDSVEWEYSNDVFAVTKELKKQGYIIVAVEQTQNSISLVDFIPEREKKYVYIFGNEVNGVQQELIDICDLVLEIPQYGTKHSLNVSVTAGICIWDFFIKAKI
ncbi:MAG: RNA methyltransferase [Bacteroidales bacterium]|nr:RNA methyltransferase [Bacteroidales bacterium]